jgi:hypothetical protein
MKPNQQQKVKQMAEKAIASDLITGTDAEEKKVETPYGEMTLWIRPLSWVDRQKALTKFVSLSTDNKGNMAPAIDFGGYWKFVLTTCVERTEPALTTQQLLNIRPEVGAAIQAVLPSFEDLMAGMAGATGPLA